MFRSADSQTNVKIDFQNMPEYINNKELGIFVFKSDLFINKGEPPINA